MSTDVCIISLSTIIMKVVLALVASDCVLVMTVFVHKITEICDK